VCYFYSKFRERNLFNGKGVIKVKDLYQISYKNTPKKIFLIVKLALRLIAAKSALIICLYAYCALNVLHNQSILPDLSLKRWYWLNVFETFRWKVSIFFIWRYNSFVERLETGNGYEKMTIVYNRWYWDLTITSSLYEQRG